MSYTVSYQCDFCDKILTTLIGIEKHLKKIHNSDW